MNDGHSVTRFLRSVQRDKKAFLPKSGGRTKVGCLHTMPKASMSCLSKEPNSIPLQLGLIELYASRRGFLTPDNTEQTGPFLSSAILASRLDGQWW